MRTAVFAATLIAIAGVLVVAGCGGDNGSEPTPVAGVSISPDAMDVEVAHSKQLTATVNGTNKNLTWYVNDIENGNEIVGEITENSPVTYTAPSWLPSPSTVLIKAISDEDTTLYDSCTVHITFNKRFVKIDGNDANNGTIDLPFRTITHAMSETDSGTTVVVFPGVYDQDNGEEFPINMGYGQGVTLVGMDWETCIIRGHSDMGYESSVSVGGQNCSFRKFTVDPGPPADPECSVAIHMGGTGNTVDSVRTSDRANYSFLRLNGSTDATIQNNYFVVTDGEKWDRGYEIISGNSGTIIRNCTVSGYHTGLFFNEDEDALVEGCMLEGNNYGAELCCFESATSNPNPDFGGGARGSTGGNSFANNATYGLYNPTYNVIYAKYNTWTNDPPVAGEDYYVPGTGGVIFQ